MMGVLIRTASSIRISRNPRGRKWRRQDALHGIPRSRTSNRVQLFSTLDALLHFINRDFSESPDALLPSTACRFLPYVLTGIEIKHLSHLCNAPRKGVLTICSIQKITRRLTTPASLRFCNFPTSAPSENPAHLCENTDRSIRIFLGSIKSARSKPQIRG